MLTRRVVLVLALCFFAAPAWAQSLTPAQLATLKTYITNDATFNARPNDQAGATATATDLNALTTAPVFIVWKSSESIREVGKAFDGGELAGLTSLNHTRLQTLGVFLSGGISPQRANHRQFFDDIFSGAGGVNTRAALLALWKRTARRIASVFATGTGSDASPATLVFEGTVSYSDVLNARNLP